ncbi:MAG TPA: DUF47 family protein [bacterium]|nr:DUF47 family protein [bacterium]HQQ00213.1 DUF47 family protein [bacterium]
MSQPYLCTHSRAREDNVVMFSFFSRLFVNIFKNRSDGVLESLFEQYARKTAECAHALDRLFACEIEERAVSIQRIMRLKGEGDLLKKQINEILDHSFIISWIDKSDATLMANQLDDCLRSMRRVVKHIQIYNVGSIRPQVLSFTAYIVKMAEEIPVMVEDLRHARYDDITSRYPAFSNLETEADDLRTAAVSDLWQGNGADPLTVMKWERIFQGLERITDHERDVADTMMSIARASK